MKTLRIELALYAALITLALIFFLGDFSLSWAVPFLVAIGTIFACVYLLWWSFEPYFLALAAVTVWGWLRGWDKETRRRKLDAFYDFDQRMLDWSHSKRDDDG